MQDFIAYFKDKVKDYNEKSDVPFKPEQVKAFVEKAVRGVPDLAIMKTQARQLAKLGHTVSLPQYYELLEDAARQEQPGLPARTCQPGDASTRVNSATCSRVPSA